MKTYYHSWEVFQTATMSQLQHKLDVIGEVNVNIGWYGCRIEFERKKANFVSGLFSNK